MNKKLKTVLAVVLFTSLIPRVSWANDLKLCGVHWPPFTYSEKELLVNGISIEVYTEAFHRLNITFTAKEVPWPRCLDGVKKGDFDAIIDNVNRPPFLNGSHPTSIYPLAMYVRTDFPQTKFSWASMKGKTIGLVRGYGYTEKILNFQDWSLDKSVTDEMLLKKLNGGRYDYAIVDVFVAPIIADKFGFNIKALTPLVDSENLYLGFNKKHAELVKRYDTVIEQIIKDGTIDKIYQKYLPYSYKDLFNKASGDSFPLKQELE